MLWQDCIHVACAEVQTVFLLLYLQQGFLFININCLTMQKLVCLFWVCMYVWLGRFSTGNESGRKVFIIPLLLWLAFLVQGVSSEGANYSAVQEILKGLLPLSWKPVTGLYHLLLQYSSHFFNIIFLSMCLCLPFLPSNSVLCSFPQAQDVSSFSVLSVLKCEKWDTAVLSYFFESLVILAYYDLRSILIVRLQFDLIS